MPDPKSPAAAADAQIAPGLRTFISVVLFLHLFAICTAMLAGNTLRLGTFSALIVGTETVMRPYLSTLLFDSPHDDFIISEEEYDDDHGIVAALEFDDGRKETIVLGEGRPLAEQRQRYVAMANQIAVQAFNANANSDTKMIPIVLCKGLLNSTGAKKIELSVRRHKRQTIADVKSSDKRFNDPHDEHFFMEPEELVYSGEAFIDDSGFNYISHEKEKTDVATPTKTGVNPAPEGKSQRIDPSPELPLAPPASFPKPLRNR